MSAVQPISAVTTSDLPAYFDEHCPADFISQTDVDLVVEGRHLPAHSQCLSRWSAVLAGCLASSPSDDLQDASQSVKIPIEGSAAAAEGLLKLIYARSVTTAIKHAAVADSKVFWDALHLAHKYGMTGLLEEADLTLVQLDNNRGPPPLWRTLTAAVEVAVTAASLSLVNLLAQVERFLLAHAEVLVLREEARNLPPESLLRILRGTLHASSARGPGLAGPLLRSDYLPSAETMKGWQQLDDAGVRSGTREMLQMKRQRLL